jgi:hypothetical protein
MGSLKGGYFMKEILFDSELERVYGEIKDWENEEHFKINAETQYKEITEKECVIKNIRIEECISTKNGICPESRIPVSLTDVIIEEYYIADVVEKESP